MLSKNGNFTNLGGCWYLVMRNMNWTRRGFLLKLGTLGSAIGAALYTPSLLASNKTKAVSANITRKQNRVNYSIKLNKKARYKTFALKNPDRVVIDLLDTTTSNSLKKGRHNLPPLNRIRYAHRDDGSLRIVLDMNQAVHVSSNLASSGSQHNLNIALQPKKRLITPAAKKSSAPRRSVSKAPRNTGKFTVVIDPGHGGKDPGAIGKRGTKEKDIALQVARRLKKRIDSNPNMRAILTRSSDKFIKLENRREIADKNKADLFISVHADANHNRRLSGSSVYILSNKGASSEAARLLAESENSYDVRFGGKNLSKRDARLASVLLDLSQDATIDQSLSFAKVVLKELSKVNTPLRRRVESAAFQVLKSAETPSLLVETAFISNPREEKRLRTSHYQQKLADAIYKGVRRYQVANAPQYSGTQATS